MACGNHSPYQSMLNGFMKFQNVIIITALFFIPSKYKQNYNLHPVFPLPLISFLDFHSTKILLSFLATLGTTTLNIPFFRLALTAS